MYTIDHGSNWRRQAVEEKIFGLDLCPAELRPKIVTAWVTTWAASPYERLEDMPWSVGVDYPLLAHVNEVTQAGVDMGRLATGTWKEDIDQSVLVPALILHDVDKPMMYARRGGEVVATDLAQEIPHGVVGGMLLKELGFPHEIISIVTTHSPKMPFHHRGKASWVLHHADMFAADRALMSMGKKPTFQK